MKLLVWACALAWLLVMTNGGEIALAGDKKPKREVLPFLVELNVGDPDHIIATNGGLIVFARCTANPTAGQPDNLRVSILATSDQDFFGTNNTNFPNAANSERTLTAFEAGVLFFQFIGDDGVLQAGGDYINLGSYGLGVHMLGSDCFAQGSAELISIK